MNRRDFTALGLAAVWPMAASAQGGPVEGKHYVALSSRQPTVDPKRIEVIEFFRYSCPACHAFEPTLEPWLAKLPADMLFRRIPVDVRPPSGDAVRTTPLAKLGPMAMHQRIYFAIETLGLMDKLHRQVFTAIHVERNPMDKPELIREWAAKQGVDANKFLDVMGAFSMPPKVAQANALTAGYKIDSTPAMGVNGRWFTTGSLAGTHAQSLAVVDFLVAQARKGG